MTRPRYATSVLRDGLWRWHWDVHETDGVQVIVARGECDTRCETQGAAETERVKREEVSNDG